MAAICGAELSRSREHLALFATVVAMVAAVLVPPSYVLGVAVASGVAAVVAPAGRRAVMSLATWVPVSFALVVGLAPVS